MLKHRSLTLALMAAVTLLGADVALARKPIHAAQKAAAETAKPSQPTGKLVEYTELEQHVGSDIIVETTLHTVRRGKLIKYTNPGLTIQLGPEHGGVELSVPRETVRNVSLVLEPSPDEATPADAGQPADAGKPAQQHDAGTGSAKKN
ncbi:hypothetical protein [Dokdonella fugitiva]|jgi:hypothetical protein|uniref:Uncharacterized protein n=1 Tax=Dokdonella fugitiva TaxID=328517 RepID=A0A4R2I8J0_9GAMM|nr:hypothetical protein [Dokdonella fugitiva]MBA8883190.1 hypothetical protein [Dokdonella fugitiva]TCO40352.1 hypothetical protein EV148_105147 [Dokdonella fugitiva]